MLLLPLAFFKSSADLATYTRRGKYSSLNELRQKVPIAVIDDEPFTPEGNLRAHGYSVTQIGDIKRLEEVKNYKVVLCDLMGVGKHFDEDRQGAGLVREIRLNYPEKVVIAYSGAPLGSAQARSAKADADFILRKDADISEWRDLLDEVVQDAVDPQFIWSRTRLRLTEMDLDTKHILVLEDAFVRSVLAEDKGAGQLQKRISTLDLAPDVRGVIQGVVASAIFTLFGGGG